MCTQNNPSSRNLHAEVVQAIISCIRSEGLEAGDRIPSLADFADLLHINRTILQDALEYLMEQGIIRQVQGEDPYLARDLSQTSMDWKVNLSTTDIILDQLLETGICEVSLSIDPVYFKNELLHGGEICAAGLCLRRVRTMDGIPFAYSIVYLPLDIPGLSMDEGAYMGSLYEYLENKCDEFVEFVETEIEAQNAQGEICRKLGVHPTTPILVMHQKHFNSSGKLLMQSADYLLRNHFNILAQRSRPGINDPNAISTQEH